MRRGIAGIAVAGTLLTILLGGPTTARGQLPAAIEDQLAHSTYVYVASTRKDGTLGEPAEIWFLHHQGAVYVGTRPTSWRVRRIKAGRPQAKIWVGKRDGPSFLAVGAIVNEPEVHERMFETFAKKYPEGWPKYEQQFRKGFEDGSRVLVKYVPEAPRQTAPGADGAAERRGSHPAAGR